MNTDNRTKPYLSDDELEEITGAKNTNKQKQVFDSWGIPCQINNRKKLVVFRAWAERAPFENKGDNVTYIKGSQPSIAGFGNG